MILNYSATLAGAAFGVMMIAGTTHAATADAELVFLVERHAQAQGAFDQATLRATTAENYLEISPVGEVDSREKMLSFYAPELKRPAPQVQVDEPTVRIMGDTALVSARLSYTMNHGWDGPQICHARRLRCPPGRPAVAAGVGAIHGHPPTETLTARFCAQATLATR